MALGPKANDFSWETIVNDHFMSKREDMDLDAIFSREPNVGDDINWWFFNQFHELIKPGVRKYLSINKYNKLTRKKLHGNHV